MSENVKTHFLILRLDDYLWFASHEWGSTTETSPVLHGYALSFALGATERLLATSGVPNYDADLAESDVYCTPARLLPDRSPSRRLGVFTFNSVEDPTLLTEARRLGDAGKVNDPKFGKRHVLLPGLRFELVAFTRRGAVLPRVFRLGKKRSPVVVEHAIEVVGRAFHGAAEPSHAINPRDVAGEVTSCVPRVIPPHFIYERASIENDDFVGMDKTIVHIPRRVTAWKSS